MTNRILIKRSNVANSIPSAGVLDSGELAINYSDGNLFYKNNSNVVTVIASNQFSSVTGNVTAGGYFIGDGGLLSNIAPPYGNANVADYLPTYTGNLVSLTGPVITTGNITAGNISTSGEISATGNITAGNVAYTNVDGTVGQVLTTHGNGQTYFSSLKTGTLNVVMRIGPVLKIPIYNGEIGVVGRSGTIFVPIVA